MNDHVFELLSALEAATSRAKREGRLAREAKGTREVYNLHRNLAIVDLKIIIEYATEALVELTEAP